MRETRRPVSVSEAIKQMTEGIKPLGAENIQIEEAHGRILGEDIIGDHDVPPFDRSPYDGFAVRAVDTAGAARKNPITLQLIEEIAAGEVAKEKVGKQQAIRIMTGAAIPDGCTAIVMLEHTRQEQLNGCTYVSLTRSYEPGDNISKQGEDTRKGSLQLAGGQTVTPGVQAVLATFGYKEVPVFRKPVVGIFAAGTHLLEIGDPLVPGKIRNSNTYMLMSQIERAGAIPRYYGQLQNGYQSCYDSIRNALDEVDVLITTGGASVGDYDYLPCVYKDLEADVVFNKVAMRPGSITTAAKWKGKPLFGLSGNPSACFVGFELFARPVLRMMLGVNTPYLKSEQAVLEEDFPKANPVSRFVRGRVTVKAGRFYVFPVGLDKSNAVTSLAQVNALIVLPGGTKGFEKGTNVDVLVLESREDFGQEEFPSIF